MICLSGGGGVGVRPGQVGWLDSYSGTLSFLTRQIWAPRVLYSFNFNALSSSMGLVKSYNLQNHTSQSSIDAI